MSPQKSGGTLSGGALKEQVEGTALQPFVYAAFSIASAEPISCCS